MKNFTIEDASFYHDIGFRCGLEVHYQLATERKLFCRCPALIRNDKPDAAILRHMRPTLSELGEYDGTALMEFKTRKDVTYQLYRDTVCTYEMDDTPPFPINRQALDYGMTIALMLDMKLVDEFHISRKQYLDGSIPTGFQRTGIIAVDGSLSLRSGNNIHISHLCLEEDACREMSDNGHSIVFRTDRLSFPLVEVITDPDIKDPNEMVETAWRIGAMLRATGKVRRGIGTVRQDVNVSVTGGRRIEIKGVQRISLFPHLVHSEALRQLNLLEIQGELRARGITAESLKGKGKSLIRTFKETEVPFFREALDNGEDIRGICLGGFAGLLNREIQPGAPFFRDFVGRVRVIACLKEDPMLLHIDDRESCGFSDEEWNSIRDTFEMRPTDVVIIVRGPEQDTKTAIEELRIRAREACEGIPPETRQALDDGTTGFERILPGPDRMYPDTDSSPIAITPEHIERIKKTLPPDPMEIEKKLLDLGLTDQLAVRLSCSNFSGWMEEAIEKEIDLGVLARALLDLYPMLRRKGLKPDGIPRETLFDIVSLVSERLYPRERLHHALRQISLNPALGPQDLLFSLPEESSVIERLKKALTTFSDLLPDKKKRAVMGEVMRSFSQRVPGIRVSELYEESTSHEG